MNTKTHAMQVKLDQRPRLLLTPPTFPSEQHPGSVIGRRRLADSETVSDQWCEFQPRPDHRRYLSLDWHQQNVDSESVIEPTVHRPSCYQAWDFCLCSLLIVVLHRVSDPRVRLVNRVSHDPGGPGRQQIHGEIRLQRLRRPY